MPAGPEMDALIHGRVFGCPAILFAGIERAACRDATHADEGGIYLPEYSTDDAAALEVLKVAGLGVFPLDGKYVVALWRPR